VNVAAPAPLSGRFFQSQATAFAMSNG